MLQLILIMKREYATVSLLKCFIDEQVQEENNFNNLLRKIRRVEDNPAVLYLMDDEFAKGVYINTTANA